MQQHADLCGSFSCGDWTLCYRKVIANATGISRESERPHRSDVSGCWAVLYLSRSATVPLPRPARAIVGITHAQGHRTNPCPFRRRITGRGIRCSGGSPSAGTTAPIAPQHHTRYECLCRSRQRRLRPAATLQHSAVRQRANVPVAPTSSIIGPATVGLTVQYIPLLPDPGQGHGHGLLRSRGAPAHPGPRKHPAGLPGRRQAFADLLGR